MNSLTAPNNLPNNIIFECSDIRNDMGLMVTKNNNCNNNCNDNDDKDNFQLHLYDGYNDIALVMNIDIQDFEKHGIDVKQVIT